MDFIREHLLSITAVIAVVALLQYWLIPLFRWLFFPGRVDIYETGNLEAGFCELGPTLGLTGTLRATGADLFVRRMKVVVTDAQNKHFEFEWNVFRDRRMTTGREQQAEFEEPSGFLVSTLAPKRFNIQFHDMDALAKMRTTFFKVHQEWAGLITKLEPAELAKRQESVAGVPEPLKDPYRDIFDAFSNTTIFRDAHQDLENACFWRAGNYTVRLVVQTARPAKQFTKENTFTLTGEDVEALRRNTDTLINDICNRPMPRPYFFAFPRHQNLSIG